VRIAVLGARGQLGAAIVHECRRQQHDVVAFGHRDLVPLDVTSDAAVAAAMAEARPEVIVNCAAYNQVDAAEDHPVDALEINALAVRAIARAAETANAAFVHFSTDFVFDGTASEPYSETDPPNPRSVYAASKLVGEWFASGAPRAYVLRVESLFGRAPDGAAKGSVEGILQALVAGDDARVFEDRTVSPSYVMDVSRATLALVERAAAPGLYHCVNSGSCTWLELGRELARQLGAAGSLVPIRLTDKPVRAQRPQYCALSNAKLAAAGVAMPPWQDALARYVASLGVRK
jgi:dTDP-4-dehydrorhamnose reductase